MEESYRIEDETSLRCPDCGATYVGELGDYCDECDALLVLDENDYDYDDGMDGDHESALASAGFGTDEDYGDF